MKKCTYCGGTGVCLPMEVLDLRPNFACPVCRGAGKVSSLIKSEKRRRFYPGIRPKGSMDDVPDATEDVFDFYIYPVADLEALTTAEQMVFRQAEQVIIIAESANPGMSVTNGMECCIQSLRNSGDMTKPWCHYIIVEHYPKLMSGEETFDLVIYDGDNIKWHPFWRNRLEQLIGEPFNG